MTAWRRPTGDDGLPHDAEASWVGPRDGQVLHRFRVEGARDDVASLDVEDLFASVQVVSTACPV